MMFSRKYNLKEFYTENLNPEYYVDIPTDFIYNPHIYELAYYLAKRSEAKYIIDIGSGNGKKLKKFVNEFKVFAVDYSINLELIKKEIPEVTFIECNLEKEVPRLDNNIIKDSIVICSEVIEHLVNIDNLLLSLKSFSEKARYLIISTPDRIRARGIGDYGPPGNPSHVREWAIDEFYDLINNYLSDFLIGYSVNTDFHLWKNNITVLSGRELQISKSMSPKKILAIIHAYNEEDIINDVVEHLINQGIDIYVLDNWSNDSTFDILTLLKDKYPDRITLDRFPECNSVNYEWELQLQKTEDIAFNMKNYDWILHYDADEIRISPWKGVTLSRAISFIDSLGYNAIDFTVIDFRPTEEDNNQNILIKNRFFEFGKRPGHFNQVKGWKNQEGTKVCLSRTGGHEAQFLNRKIYPIKFLTKHYPLRSTQQAKKKIFIDRIPRFEKENREKGWHTQYNNISEECSFIYEKQYLINWNENFFMSDFLIERISGIGIIKEER